MEQTFFSIPLEKYYLKPTRGEGGGGKTSYGTWNGKNNMVSFFCFFLSLYNSDYVLKKIIAWKPQ